MDNIYKTISEFIEESRQEGIKYYTTYYHINQKVWHKTSLKVGQIIEIKTTGDPAIVLDIDPEEDLIGCAVMTLEEIEKEIKSLEKARDAILKHS